MDDRSFYHAWTEMDFDGTYNVHRYLTGPYYVKLGSPARSRVPRDIQPRMLERQMEELP